MSQATPTKNTERILSLDVLRGFAILGILIMNIQGMSMPADYYGRFTPMDAESSSNYWIWFFSHVFAEQKFMTIFSLLFGAGIILQTQRLEKKSLRPARVYFRRTFWLCLFGFLHAYFIWYGDILLCYGVCGFLVFWLRKVAPKKLLIVGTIFYLVPFLLILAVGFAIPHFPPEDYKEMVAEWSFEPEKIEQEIENYQSPIWSDQQKQRVETAYLYHVYLIFFAWCVAGLMMLGMGLFQYGVFSATAPPKLYRRLVLLALLVGFPTILIGVYTNQKAEWHHDYSAYFGTLFNYGASVLVSLGYISAVMLLCQKKYSKITYPMSVVGKLALSNYILQSVLGTFVFYGFGLGYFGVMERSGQILVIGSIWIFQIFFSIWWMKNFQFGPLEWVWRCLTYGEIFPNKSPKIEN